MIDPEKRRASNRAYRAAHREELRAKGRAYAAAHPEERRAWAAAHREENRARSRAYYAANPEKTATRMRRRLYGPDADFEALVASQNGRCAGGCDQPPTCIDHNHDTGAVRGALCNRCNLEDVLGRNSLTDPDLSRAEMDQLEALVGAALKAGSSKLAWQRAYRARQKAEAAEVQANRLAEIDAQAAAMGWL